MESESYRYVPIDTIQQENQFMSSKDPCCSGNNGNCVGATKCDRGPAKESGHTVLEDVFYLEHVGQVTVAISDSHLVWRRLEDEYFELVRFYFLSLKKNDSFEPLTWFQSLLCQPLYCQECFFIKTEVMLTFHRNLCYILVHKLCSLH